LGGLAAGAMLLAFPAALIVHAIGLRSPRPERRTGSAVLDYFLGASLNPRIGSFDLKFFFESRPSLIGWALVDLSCAAAQREIHGRLSAPMILVLSLQLLYIADYFWHEEAILSTIDLKHENFGWMLLFGNLVFVPFFFSLQAAFLVSHPGEIRPAAAAAIVLLDLFGYA